MKTKCWLILSVMLSTTLLAQSATNSPANKTAPKKAAAKKAAPAATKKAAAEKPIVLVPGAATITGDNVNVRGKATFVGEIIKRLNRGDNVKVIEQVIREKPKADEPSQWAKIGYPAGASVWVHASYVDATNKVVLPKRLNVRAGPGENYSIVGLIERGAPVKEISTKGNWVEIEAPGDAYVYVAAMYLKQEGTAPAFPPIVSIAPALPEPPPTPAPVTEPPPVAPTTTDVATTKPLTEPPGVTPAPEAPNAEPPPAEEPLPPRIVAHEGVVRPTVSIQAPTPYEIWDPSTRMSINYLYSPSTNLNLARYKGLRIIVTGEEGLDVRWRNVPVLTVQRIQVVE